MEETFWGRNQDNCGWKKVIKLSIFSQDEVDKGCYQSEWKKVDKGRWGRGGGG